LPLAERLEVDGGAERPADQPLDLDGAAALQGGSRSSSVAVTSTWVSPNFTMQEPSAYLTTPRSSDTGRSSSGARRLGRMGNPFEKWCHLSMIFAENRYPLFRIMP
jgi:hypothetical protein